MDKKTYTYTARSVSDPAQVITFTLYDENMSVELGAPMEHIERALQSEEGDEAGSSAWLKPVVISLLERGTQPFNIADVDASTEEGSLRVIAWNRSGGLRLAPLIFAMGEIDNPVAAGAFVKELHRRKQHAEYPGKFPVPLDYWASWILAGFLAFSVLIWWYRRLGRESNSTG